MSRYRQSLSQLGRFSAIESQAQGSGYRPTAVPDFLAPSLYHRPATSHRHNASFARVAIAQPDLAASSDNVPGPSTSSANANSPQADYVRQTRSATSRNTGTDFSSYFDADSPATPPFGLSISDTADIEARIDTAEDIDQLALAADEIYRSDRLHAERRRARQVHLDASRDNEVTESVLDLNEHFILYLLRASIDLAERTSKTHALGETHLPSSERLVAKYLGLIHACSPLHGLSPLSLFRLSSEAGSTWTSTLLDRLLKITDQRLSHRTSDATAATTEADDTAAPQHNIEEAQLWSHVLLNLMQAYSHQGQSDSVRACFDVLTKRSLPTTIFHYQFQLISFFREHTSAVAGKSQLDVQQSSHDMQKRILEIKALMEANGIHLDDTFLSAIISGLGAPLRNPLAALTSVEQKKSTLDLVRTVFHQLADAGSSKSFRSSPRALSALVKAEIDALHPKQRVESPVQTKTVDRIQTLIAKLDSPRSSRESSVVGILDNKPLVESRLDRAYLRLRLYAAVGDFDRGMSELRRLLAIEPAVPPHEASAQRDELVLKQRSSIITLFSAAMRERHDNGTQDASFHVLQHAFSSRSFARVWTGIALPSNPSSGFDPKNYEGNATVLRLWKRWMDAWSMDYWTEGTPTETGEVDCFEAGKKKKRRTYTGSYPWQTLKRGLKLLNLTMDQYEAFHAGRPYSAIDAALPDYSSADSNLDYTSHEFNLSTKPPRYITQFSCLFTERNVLNNIVYLCVHGGRPPRPETVATHVQRRLSLLLRTLTRVYAPARTWEHVEASMLHHLARIPCDVLPTELVKPTMETIEQRKRVALLRNRDLVKALEEESVDQPETGSIFVLRQMLKQRELAKAQHLSRSTPIFT